jgi:hypothetical protein
VLNPITHRKVLKKGMPGRATIIESGAMDRGATRFNLPMTLQVHVEGITPYEVEGQWWVKAKDGAALTSGPVAVKVDREDHQLVAIDWDTVRREYEERRRARQEALAPGGSRIATNVSAEHVIDLPAADLGEAQDALRQMGVDVDLESAIGGAAAQPSAGGHRSASAGDGEDPISKLERLSALRASGALTEEEFKEQKRRILGE